MGRHEAWKVTIDDGSVIEARIIMSHEPRREAVIAGDMHRGLAGLAGTMFSLPLKAQYLMFGYDTLEELAAELARRIPMPARERCCAVYMLTLDDDAFHFLAVPVTGKHALPARPVMSAADARMRPVSNGTCTALMQGSVTYLHAHGTMMCE
jgi:hypothetical protein